VWGVGVVGKQRKADDADDEEDDERAANWGWGTLVAAKSTAKARVPRAKASSACAL